MNRRKLFVFGGGAVLIALAGGAALTVKDSSKARQPWREAGAIFDDARLNALSYAILAPNPHNRQPWLIELAEDPMAFTLFCQLDRRLPMTDPADRQITIGLGAFLELFKMAAAEQGFEAAIEAFPEGEAFPRLDARPIARVRLNPANAQTDPLFRYALDRRTNRNTFEDRDVPAEVLSKVFAKAGLKDAPYTVSADRVGELIGMSRDAWLIEMATERTHQESTKLMRVGAKAVTANPDGITLLGPFMEASRLTGMMDAEEMNDPASQAYAGTKKFYLDLIDSAKAFGWLITPGNRRVDQLAAGADWLRLNLAATEAGLALQPLSQALQEFPEMAQPFGALHDFLGVQMPSRVQGLFRFGYAKIPIAAPRWPLASRLAS